MGWSRNPEFKKKHNKYLMEIGCGVLAAYAFIGRLC
jgi:hypothetical protein